MPTPRNELIAELADANRKLTEAIERIKAAAEHRAGGNNDTGGVSAREATRFRKLRISWSVAWVLVCLSLIILWVLSYSEMNRWDIQMGRSGGISVWILMGRIVAEPNLGPQQWEITRESLDDFIYWEEWDRNSSRWDFGLNDRYQWTVPIWLPAMLAAAFSIAPWIPWSTRFSIRAILILTTLVAAVLGMIVYSVSK